MKKPFLGKVPQIVSISPVNSDGKLRLVKVVKDYLELQEGQPLFLDVKDEVRLSSKPISKTEISVNRSGALFLPVVVMQKLEISKPAIIGLVQRPDAVAVKVVEVEEVERESARLVDIETPTKIVRRIEAPPMPEDFIPKLQAEFAASRLPYDVKAFVKGRSTIDAWKIRQLLDCPEPDDDDLRKEMITQRFNTQDADGSWSGSVFQTSRNLRELAELGVDKNLDNVKQAVSWLVNRSRSAYNPGMFFATDALVEEQAGVMEQRKIIKRGTRPRFRQIKKSEQKNVMSGDDLIYADDFEASCISRYRCGGLNHIDELKQADVAHRTFAMRLAEVTSDESENDEKYYILGMDNHIQGCEFITTRSLSRVRDPKARRFAEAHLWRFASTQHADDGAFPSEKYGTGFHQAGILQAISRYDHPVAKVIVLRALPWIVKNQNKDGSWGEGERKDVETYSVVYALLSLGNILPDTIVKTL